MPPAPLDVGADLLELLVDPTWVFRQYDHQLFLNTVEGPGGDATRAAPEAPHHRRGHRPGPRPHLRRQPPLVRPRPPPGHGARGGRGGDEPGLRRGPPARARELPQLRQPRAPRGDVAAVRGDRRHGRGVPGLRDPGRGRQRQPLQREPRPRHRPHPGRRAGRARRPARPAAARACASSTAAPCSRSAPSRARSPGRAGPGSAGRTSGPAAGPRPRRARRGGRRSCATLVADGLLAGVHDTADGIGVALAEMAVRSRHGVPGRGPRAPTTRGCSPSPPSRVVACVTERPREDVVRAAQSAGVAAATLGRVGGDRLVVEGLLDVERRRRRSTAWRGRLPDALGAGDARPERSTGREPRSGGVAAARLADWCRARRRRPRRPVRSTTVPKEACGVFGVYAPGQPVAHLTYLGLFALQHRGQESAGMAVSDGADVTVVKDQGLVAAVFDDRTLAGLDGHLAIGHCRYSTTGSSHLAQRPARLPRRRRPPLRPRPQRQPHQHRGAGRRGGDAPGHRHQRHRPRRRADRQRARRTCPRRRATTATSSGRSPRCCPGSRAPSPSCSWTRPA